MSVLKGMQPERVLHYFEEISAIPHGSGQTKAISDYCVAFAKAHGLQWWQDESNNVVIVKEATAGYENAPAMILQGHLDMVWEKTPDCDLDFATQGLRLRTDGAWVWAEGTTLGSDDGIAVAMALAALESDSLCHPRLEAVLTVDEEIGMMGAVALQPDMLQGRLLLNVDSEVEGVFTVSCAGGVRASCHVPVEREAADGICCRIVIDGLVGGHSGMEINKGRANSNMLMGRLLYSLSREMPLRLVELSGGQADNAIASFTEAVVLLQQADTERASHLVQSDAAVFAHEYQTAEPGLKVTFAWEPAVAKQPLTAESTGRVVSALMCVPNGVQTMSMDIPGLVQTSLNLGILRLEQTEAVLTFAVRSALATEKALICNRLECATELLGGAVTYQGDYPAWEYKKDSKLRTLVAEVYEKQTGKKPIIEAIHAGLECGVFAGKLPGLDCISLGPDLKEIHTPRERMSVESVARTWELVCEVLRRAKEL